MIVHVNNACAKADSREELAILALNGAVKAGSLVTYYLVDLSAGGYYHCPVGGTPEVLAWFTLARSAALWQKGGGR